MKKLSFLFFTLTLTFISCSDDDDNAPVLPPAIESKQITNIFAPQIGGPGSGQDASGEFTKFDFKTGEVTTSDTDWDIAFRATAIAINGGVVTGSADEPIRNGNAGAAIVENTFASVNSADGLTFNQDADGAFAIPTGSDNGWYNYNFMTNVVSPIPGTVLVFRTRDGRYAKVQIASYYKDAPTTPNGSTDESRYYTFNYVYNPNEGDKNL
ncbi:HmuY family protein [Aquimarina sp. MMG016]|uniref:HmuY family protein n=1 Tax=Aquimarina sp. MMG016 TaxID=2822690 RepID=UPI001B39ED09|nr:HmuY family protein [Aquimarina sp. MMG016]MBQ4821703.1 HmuY family protein [Aquimarina sp. MMG016]